MIKFLAILLPIQLLAEVPYIERRDVCEEVNDIIIENVLEGYLSPREADSLLRRCELIPVYR